MSTSRSNRSFILVSMIRRCRSPMPLDDGLGGLGVAGGHERGVLLGQLAQRSEIFCSSPRLLGVTAREYIGVGHGGMGAVQTSAGLGCAARRRGGCPRPWPGR